jgi:hypothetical protein
MNLQHLERSHYGSTDFSRLKQISEGKRNRKYAYKAYIDILSEGTELLGDAE